MNSQSLHGETSPGLAVKSGLWADIDPVKNQSEMPSMALVGRFPSSVPAASRLFTAARKLDRYKHERVNGTVKQADGETTLDTSEMRTRLNCSDDSVITIVMRCLFAPLYPSHERSPFTALAAGSKLEFPTPFFRNEQKSLPSSKLTSGVYAKKNVSQPKKVPVPHTGATRV